MHITIPKISLCFYIALALDNTKPGHAGITNVFRTDFSIHVPDYNPKIRKKNITKISKNISKCMTS